MVHLKTCVWFNGTRGPWLAFGAVILLAAGALAACADKQVTLRYQPDPAVERLATSNALTIFHFSDRRGSEGDQDTFRVGGVYVGFWTRLVKVVTDTPWPQTLSRALADAFMARGVPVTIAYRAFTAGTAFATPLALAGDIQNFSTEFRWLTSAHISGVVRLYDRQGSILFERKISDRETWGMGADGPLTEEPLEDTLNKALVGFVSKVVTDPELSSYLARPRQ